MMWKTRLMVVHLDCLTLNVGTAQDEQEQLASNHCETQTMVRKVRPSIDVASTALRKEETAACLQAIRDK
jgi:hypothetical protein